MDAILQGSLRHFTAADLLMLFASRMQSGTIDFECKGEKARVVLRDGKVAGAGGPDAVATVGAACYWTEGTFALVPDMLLGEGVVPVDYEVGALLDEVARRAAAEKAEAERYNDNVTFRVIDNADAQEQLGLSADELKLLIRIGLGRKISDLIGKRDRKEFIQTLKRLEGGGVIERIGGESSGEAPWKPEPEAPKKEAPKPQAKAPKPEAKAEPAPAAKAEKPAAPPKAEPKPEPKQEPKPAPKPEPKAEPRPEPKPQAKPEAAAEATQSLRPERTAGRGLMASLTADSGDAFPLIEDEIVIGRAAGSGITLTDGSISTRHARISRAPEGFFIEDLKSRNGSFVNGEPVTEKRMLNDNDTVRLGKVIFTFNLARELRAGDTTAGIGR